MKKLRITVAGKPYEVTVEVLDSGSPVASPMAAPAPTPVAAASVAAPVATLAAPRAAASADDVVCPISGKVVSVDVKQGQAVEEGMQLATVEAMKMNTYIYAPKAGTVKAIMVAAGDGVEEGMAMFRMS